MVTMNPEQKPPEPVEPVVPKQPPIPPQSASTGAEISIFPMIIYFSGMAMWAYSSVENLTVRYTVMALSLLCALAFMHFGEVLFWHKYLIYWGTIGVVVFFMFKTPKKPAGS
ncbi:MAG: hypothetical protein P8X46_01985 [Nitrospirales bacterium]